MHSIPKVNSINGAKMYKTIIPFSSETIHRIVLSHTYTRTKAKNGEKSDTDITVNKLKNCGKICWKQAGIIQMPKKQECQFWVVVDIQ